MSQTVRLFIAIELPAAVTTILTIVQNELKSVTPQQTVRWVDPAGIHLTLKFLGEVPVDSQDTLRQALQQAVIGHAPFALNTGRLGCFPNAQKPRVIWLDVERDLQALGALQRSIEQVIAPLGYPTEQRAFSPHLTLGRVRREAQNGAIQQLGKVLSESSSPRPTQWDVISVNLIRSDLNPTGAVYTTIARTPLQSENSGE